MTQFSYKQTTTGVPIISDEDIENDVSILLSDFNADLL